MIDKNLTTATFPYSWKNLEKCNYCTTKKCEYLLSLELYYWSLILRTNFPKFCYHLLGEPKYKKSSSGLIFPNLGQTRADKNKYLVHLDIHCVSHLFKDHENAKNRFREEYITLLMRLYHWQLSTKIDKYRRLLCIWSNIFQKNLRNINKQL